MECRLPCGPGAFGFPLAELVRDLAEFVATDREVGRAPTHEHEQVDETGFELGLLARGQTRAFEQHAQCATARAPEVQ